MENPIAVFCLASALAFPACSTKPKEPSITPSALEQAEINECLGYMRSADSAEGLQ